MTLKFGSANYLADVWLNGTYLGYHEGGWTPFAFDVGKALLPGVPNDLAVRIADPPLGTRLDIVPWNIADTWDYVGLTGPVWLEASNVVHVVRANAHPHLDAADVSVVLQNSGAEAVDGASIMVEMLPAAVTADNLLNPDPHGVHHPSLIRIAGVDVVSSRAASFCSSSTRLTRPKSESWLPHGVDSGRSTSQVGARRASTGTAEVNKGGHSKALHLRPESKRTLSAGLAAECPEPAAVAGQSLTQAIRSPTGPRATYRPASAARRRLRSLHMGILVIRLWRLGRPLPCTNQPLSQIRGACHQSGEDSRNRCRRRQGRDSFA